MVIDAYGNELRPPGDPAVRPIAAGEFWRRLIGKFVVTLPQTVEDTKLLHPEQVGVGMRAAIDLVPQGIQSIVNQLHSIDPSGDWALCKIDFKNALNETNRSMALAGAAKRCPSILPSTEACYAQHTNLVCGTEILQSRTGVHQGDPMGPLLFSLAIQDILDDMPDHLWQVWYLDDGHIIRHLSQLRNCLEHIIALKQ